VHFGGRSKNWLLAALIGSLIGAAVGNAQTPAFPPDHHPWGRFPIGSWKLTRVVAEVLDTQGRVANVTATDTKTTLVASDASSYTLRVDVTVEVAGRRFSSVPQIVKHGYYGETPGQPVSVKDLGDSQLALDGRMVACELRQATIESEGIKRVSTIHYSSSLPPYQLRRETTAEVAVEEKEKQKATTLVEIIALDLPQRVVGEIKKASYVKTTHKQPQGSKVTLEVQCDDVPGGVVSHWASETDSNGKTLRRSTLELLDYEVQEPKKGEISYGRRRFHRRAARRMDDR
jgi:hypothetical protein